jgi:membrane associated rhomboid family serine protease
VFVLQLVLVRDERVSLLDRTRKYNPKIDRLISEAEKDPEARKKLEKSHPELVRMMDKDDDLDDFVPTMKVSIVQEWLQLDTKKVVEQGQVWRLLTCSFCHDRYGIFHIIFNMVFLIWFGCTLERMYGTREFLLFYLTAAVAASLAFVALDLYTGSSVPAVGASGAVFGVVMLYCMHFPHETVCICWITIELRWLVLIYLIWDLHPVLLMLTGDPMASGVAHAAHLGGLAFGFLYARSSWRLESVFNWLPGFRVPSVRRARPERRAVATTSGCATHVEEMDRVDLLLEKISRSGADSLTDEEREYLKRASQRIKRRTEDGGDYNF